jgi:Protein of unknown function (DUF3631)
MSGRVSLDDFNAIPAASVPVEWDGELAQLLEETRAFFRRFIVVDDVQADTVALWVAHSYVFHCARATPYLYFWSPEYGSGKTTALEVLEVVTRAGLTADDLSGAALFRLIEARHPTLLLDELDGVFGKKGSESAEDHRKLLNSGYRAGKRVFRCGGKNHTELQEFDVYCPKALAGLNEIPGTLAHRAIAISMKPPRPQDGHVDFDSEEAEAAASYLRGSFQLWAEAAEGDLRDPRLKPAKLPELDARRNEIWRILFRIADLAGRRWPEAARRAAIELSGGERRNTEASLGVKLLADTRVVRENVGGDKISCHDLAAALNALEESPWGGWSDGGGIKTRELGRKLGRYGIRAKTVRMDDGKFPKGYEWEQFDDAWSRYLPETGISTATTATTGSQTQKSAERQPPQDDRVAVVETPANPHQQRVVPVVAVSKSEYGEGPREALDAPTLTGEEREQLKREIDRRSRERLEAPPDPEQLEADRRLFAEADELGDVDQEEIERLADLAREALYGEQA